MKPLKIRCAEVAGYDAARDQRPPEENPYPDGSAEHLAWER